MQTHFLSLYFHNGTSQGLSRDTKRGFLISSNRVARRAATRNEDTPDPCEVKWNRAGRGERKMNKQLNLVLLLAYAFFVVGCSNEREGTVQWYCKMAERGDAEAQFHLAGLYFSGDGVIRNERDAAKWYRKAAEQGHVEARHCLAGLYFTGIGVGRNYTEAEKWYRKAAEHGFAESQYCLGGYYFGQKNYREAFKWFGKAAAQGHADSQDAVEGLSRLFPLGVP